MTMASAPRTVMTRRRPTGSTPRHRTRRAARRADLRWAIPAPGTGPPFPARLGPPAGAVIRSLHESAYWRTDRGLVPVSAVRRPLPADLFRDLPDHIGPRCPVVAGQDPWRDHRRHHQLRRHLRGPGIVDQGGPRCP